MTAADPNTVSSALLAAYEELRHQFLEPVAGSVPGLGLALLLERGMRAWMEACADVVPRAAAPEELRPCRQTLLSPSARTEMVVLLAGMALEVSGKVIGL